MNTSTASGLIITLHECTVLVLLKTLMSAYEYAHSIWTYHYTARMYSTVLLKTLMSAYEYAHSIWTYHYTARVYSTGTIENTDERLSVNESNTCAVVVVVVAPLRLARNRTRLFAFHKDTLSGNHNAPISDSSNRTFHCDW